MEMNVSAGAEALKEISREKNRIFGKKVETPSALEHAALAWKRKRQAEERQGQKESLEKEEALGLSFHDAIAKEVVDYDKQKLADLSRVESKDEKGWVQFNPWKKEDEGKKAKQISINTATVVAIRKKLIAQEWARALGKSTGNNKTHNLERLAADWYQKRDEEKKRREEKKARTARHKESLSETLAEFTKTLREEKVATTEPLQAKSRAEVEQFRMRRKAMDPKNLAALLEESLADAGEVFDIEWQEDGCLIWIEPWEEKKLRKISDFDIPVIYRAKIDANLEVSSYEAVEDQEVIESLKQEILTKPFRESLEGVSFNMDDEKQAQQFLEDKLSEIGRLISLERIEDGWLATIEPWEEMRLRNTERKGNPPIITDQIEINWKDGQLEFAPEAEATEESLEQSQGEDLYGKEVVEMERNETLVTL